MAFAAVSSSDIEDMLDDLSGAELDAVIGDMSDDELERWIDELNDGTFGSGWSRERRREMWSMIASKASAETMQRLSEFTDEVQPAFDEVGGDDAGDGTSPVDDAEYTEVPHELFVDGVDPHDVVQGSIGDCWLIASMAALANTNPDAISDLIQANPNGTYTVTLYDGDDPVEVTVTPDIPTVDGDPLFADNASGGDPYELWPHLLEKAAAQYYGDYTDIEGDWPSKALQLFTGVRRQHARRRIRLLGRHGSAVGRRRYATPSTTVAPCSCRRRTTIATSSTRTTRSSKDTPTTSTTCVKMAPSCSPTHGASTAILLSS